MWVDRPLIAYRWALDMLGRPVSIADAQRGAQYRCPLCHGQMIARLGDQIQHHFAHTDETDCTPEAVTRAALRRWITITLREAVADRELIRVSWSCHKCGQTHSADLIAAVTYVHEGYMLDNQHYADVAAVDAGGKVHAI